MKHLIPTFGGTVVGVGGLTYGGLEAYKKLKPTTWAEILSAEGYEYINQDMKDESGQKIWWVLKQKNNSGFIDNVDKSKEYKDVKTQCVNKLKTKVDRYSKDYSTELEKIKKTCVKEGPKSTQEWINQKIWEQSSDPKETLILRSDDQKDESQEKEEFEIMFAVYRHEHEDTPGGLPQFLDWLKQQSGKTDLTKDGDIAQGGTELKNACKKLFDKSRGNISSGEYGNYRSGFMWCRKLPYSTIKEKVDRDKNFEKETDWNTVKEKWKDTAEVKSAVKESGEPDANDYETYCGNGTANKKLNAQDAYQKTYLIYKSVCYKPKPSAP